MNYIPRHIDKYLLDWKADKHRKPLLLRGARQIGKSSSVRHLGQSFEYFLEINLEKQTDAIEIFRSLSDVHEIAQRLSALTSVPVIPGKTLLFIDEIQCSADAIKMLRYFKEDYPELHVIAAGSLLEFALTNAASFGVGRISSLFMYPLSFKEFLIAIGRQSWVDEIERANCDSPLFEALHKNLVETFRTFLLVGGMPASVAMWVEEHSYLRCQEILEDIQQTYFDDFSKYASHISPELLRSTLQSVVAQGGKKFVYTRGLESYKTQQVKDALTMLMRAGLLIEVSYSAANGLPLGAEVNPKFKKYLLLDTGLLLRIMDLDMGGSNQLNEFILTCSTPDLVNKGSLAEMFVGLEFVKTGNPRISQNLFYWENLNRGAAAEVDFIAAYNMSVLPIEVKSGVSGKMKSLRLFMETKSIDRGVRTSLENFGRLDVASADDRKATISIIPLYAIYNYQNYL